MRSWQLDLLLALGAVCFAVAGFYVSFVAGLVVTGLLLWAVVGVQFWASVDPLSEPEVIEEVDDGS